MFQNNQTKSKFSMKRNLVVMTIMASLILSFLGCTNAKLLTLVKEGKSHLQGINQALAALDTASAKTEENAADMFGQLIPKEKKDANEENKVIDWSSPSEVVVILQSSHEEIDRSEGAQQVSQQLPKGVSISKNGQTWTPVSGGMKGRVLDHISFKVGGSGQNLTWDIEKVKQIVTAAEVLKVKFSNASDGLGKVGSDVGADLVKQGELGAKATEQILSAAKEILAAQESSAKNTKPDEKAVQVAIERMLKARGELREIISSYDAILKQLAPPS